jgi:hypothetical protein
VVQCLSIKCEALSSNPSTAKKKIQIVHLKHSFLESYCATESEETKKLGQINTEENKECKRQNMH